MIVPVVSEAFRDFAAQAPSPAHPNGASLRAGEQQTACFLRSGCPANHLLPFGITTQQFTGSQSSFSACHSDGVSALIDSAWISSFMRSPS